jgi:lipopolysaccharide export LptBFGC system permease protein LptF
LKRRGIQILSGFVFFGGLLLAFELKSISKIVFEQGASIHHMVPLLLTTIPWNVGLILPMAAVLGGLLGTQHLSEGSEFVVLQGLGSGKRTFLLPWAFLSAIMVASSAANSHWLSPWASKMEHQLFYELAQETALTGKYAPQPGEGPKLIKGGSSRQKSGDGQGDADPLSDLTVYWGQSKDDGKLHIMQIGSDYVSHLVGDKYSYKIEKVGDGDEGMLEQIQISFRFEEVNGRASSKEALSTGRLTDLSYKVFEISQPVSIEKNSIYQPTTLRHLGTKELLAAAKSEQPLMGTAGVELSRRFSSPIVCCALLLLGISIGLSHPRFYKGGAFVKSIGVILLYFVLLKVLEGWVENGTVNWIYATVLLPAMFLAAGLALLNKKMYPTKHGRNNRVARLLRLFQWMKPRHVRALLKRTIRHALHAKGKAAHVEVPQADLHGADLHGHGDRANLMGRWTSRRWWASFFGVLAIFLVFHIFVEFASLAQFVAMGGGRFLLFFKYWAYNLPVTLPFVLPIVFLLAWVLTFSEASISREWTALRAGGVSLVRWVGSSWKAWGLAIIASFAVEAYIAPKAYAIQSHYYGLIKGHFSADSELGSATSPEEPPTSLYLGSTGVFWQIVGPYRWGFPLLPTSEAPALIYWERGEQYSQQLNWDGTSWGQGLETDTLFPDSSLKQYQTPYEIPTADLFTWQEWAPSAERATMLWGRMLKWLAAPCLFFAALGFAFPASRKGRGQALGYALMLSLAYLWMQGLFEGASKSGQLPALWGVLAPMIMMLGFGLVNLHRLRT